MPFTTPAFPFLIEAGKVAARSYLICHPQPSTGWHYPIRDRGPFVHHYLVDGKASNHPCAFAHPTSSFPSCEHSAKIGPVNSSNIT